MSNEKLIVGYDVTVRGQYHAASGKDRILKTFGPVTFFLPEYVEIPNGRKKVQRVVDGRLTQMFEPQFAKKSIATDNVALWVIQRRLLPTWLAQNHPDCVTFRTCQITPGGMKRVQRPAADAIILDKPVREMSIHELAAFCKMKNLVVPVSAFKDVEEARAAVLMEMESAGVSSPRASDAAAAPGAIPAEEVPAGVRAAAGPTAPIDLGNGRRSPNDGVPVDEQDATADLI